MCTAADCAHAALQQGVSVDVVLIGYTNSMGRAVAQITGGRTHEVDDMAQLLAICEEPSFVQGDTPTPQLPRSASLQQVKHALQRAKATPYHHHKATTQPVPPVTPSLLLRGNVVEREVSTAARALYEQANVPAKIVVLRAKKRVERLASQRSPPPARRNLRLMLELSRASRFLERHRDVARVLTESEQLTPWRVVMSAPAETPWEGGCFELALDLGADYPLQPPTATFVTPLLHPNVDARSGRACHSILGTAYTSETTVYHIILAMRSLLLAPEPSDALNQQVALLYRDHDLFTSEVKKHVDQHARGSIDELEAKILRAYDQDRDSEDSDAEDSEEDEERRVCALTDLPCALSEACETKYGFTYRKTALEAFFQESGLQCDPKASQLAGTNLLLSDCDVSAVVSTINDHGAFFLTAAADVASRDDENEDEDDAASSNNNAPLLLGSGAVDYSSSSAHCDDGYGCFKCGRPVSAFAVVCCARCRAAPYCSSTCRAAHAREHALFCAPPKAPLRRIEQDDAISRARRQRDDARALLAIFYAYLSSVCAVGCKKP